MTKILNILLIISLLLCSQIITKSLKKALTKQYYNKLTTENDDGKGQTIFLDKHLVYCNPGQILQRYHLFRPSVSTLSYEYTCTAYPAVGTEVIEIQTPLNDIDLASSNVYLDRHNVGCPEGYALQSFNLMRGGPNLSQIQYLYYCVRIALGGACQSFETPEQWAHAGPGDFLSSYYLDRQYVNVPDGPNAMQKFRLLSRYAPERTYLRYYVIWCPLDNRVTLRGYIKDANTQSVIPKVVLTSAKIVFKTSAGAVTEAQILDGGIYEVKLLPGAYTRIGNIPGYVESKSSINISSNRNQPDNSILFTRDPNGF
jgi:hypothetical protein